MLGFVCDCMEYRKMKRLILLFLLVLGSMSLWGNEQYPAWCKVKTNLNVRSGPGTNYTKLGKLYPNTDIIVNDVVYNNSRYWGIIDYQNKTGYVAMKYISFTSAIIIEKNEPVAQDIAVSDNSNLWEFLDSKMHWISFEFRMIWHDIWPILRILLIILFVLLLLAYGYSFILCLIIIGVCTGIGAFFSKIYLHDIGPGALCGFIVGVYIVVRRLFDKLGYGNLKFLMFAYYIISFPVYFLNKLQFVLVEPWRFMVRYNWGSDGYRAVMRIIFLFLKIILYILTTPLRLLNAILYNIVIRLAAELYDLFIEVFEPSDPKEGHDNSLRWVLMLPWRIIKYMIVHGGITFIDSVIWTIIDIFLPAITLYHGTDLTAAQAITCSPNRNSHLKAKSTKTHGMFTASSSSWGGIGVYFASRRSVARKYAFDCYRLSDNNPVMIVCRVTPGNIINYALAPDYVYRNAGEIGNPAVINKYAERHGYTTGQWWNPVGNYWEYCMFDWQNKYNYPWRIRPIYIFNFRTGTIQHIKGGTRHWLFEKDTLNTLFKP